MGMLLFIKGVYNRVWSGTRVKKWPTIFSLILLSLRNYDILKKGRLKAVLDQKLWAFFVVYDEVIFRKQWEFLEFASRNFPSESEYETFGIFGFLWYV